jgi:rRNA pseudouridine-1189 N-methylase Emg1 (Nep1/Mra1 family)
MILDHAAIVEAAKREGMADAALLLIDLGHTDAAKVLIDRLNGERIAAFVERNEALVGAKS